MHRTDAASIKLLAREYPGALYSALKHTLKYNKKSTAAESLQRKCLAAWEHGNISALIDFYGGSVWLMGYKEYVKRYSVR